MELFQTIDILIFLAYALVFLCIVTKLTSTILGVFFFFVAITNLERDSLYFHLLRVILLLPQEEVLSLLGGFHRHKEKN